MHTEAGVGAHLAEMGRQMTRCMVVPTMIIHICMIMMVDSVDFHHRDSLSRRSIKATEMRITQSAHTQSTPSAATSGPTIQGSGAKPWMPRP